MGVQATPASSLRCRAERERVVHGRLVGRPRRKLPTCPTASSPITDPSGGVMGPTRARGEGSGSAFAPQIAALRREATLRPTPLADPPEILGPPLDPVAEPAQARCAATMMPCVCRSLCPGRRAKRPGTRPGDQVSEGVPGRGGHPGEGRWDATESKRTTVSSRFSMRCRHMALRIGLPLVVRRIQPSGALSTRTLSS